MNNTFVAVAGFALVLLGLIATVCVFAFQDGIQELEWIDAEAAALGSMVICLAGTILGWICFRNSTGVIAGVLGSLLLAFYVFQLFRVSDTLEPDYRYPAKLQDPPMVKSKTRMIEKTITEPVAPADAKRPRR